MVSMTPNVRTHGAHCTAGDALCQRRHWRHNGCRELSQGKNGGRDALSYSQSSSASSSTKAAASKTAKVKVPVVRQLSVAES